MMILGLLFVVCCFSVITVRSCFQVVGGHVCVSDYWSNISCVLNISSKSPGPGPLCLKFTETTEKTTVFCPLLRVAHSYVSDCKVKSQQNPITSDDEYDIQLCDKSGCTPLQMAFVPREHVQLTPPPELWVRHSADGVNITCSSRYGEFRYISNFLNYQLLLQAPPTRTLQVDVSPAESSVVRRVMSSQQHSEFCVKARYTWVEDGVHAIWSVWSNATCWTDGAPDGEKVSVVLAKCFSLLCVMAAVLWVIVNIPALRTKMKMICFTPSPALFFKQTNVQDWLSPPGKRVVALQTEEIFTSVSLVPNVVWNDPEDTLGMVVAPLNQMSIPQAFTSYVVLDQVNTPVGLLSLEHVGTERVPPLDQNFIKSIHEENLSQRPESSSPPQTCYSDYCVLNKTPQGFVPHLVSTENSMETRGAGGTSPVKDQ